MENKNLKKPRFNSIDCTFKGSFTPISLNNNSSLHEGNFCEYEEINLCAEEKKQNHHLKKSVFSSINIPENDPVIKPFSTKFLFQEEVICTNKEELISPLNVSHIVNAGVLNNTLPPETSLPQLDVLNENLPPLKRKSSSMKEEALLKQIMIKSLRDKLAESTWDESPIVKNNWDFSSHISNQKHNTLDLSEFKSFPEREETQKSSHSPFLMDGYKISEESSDISNSSKFSEDSKSTPDILIKAYTSLSIRNNSFLKPYNSHHSFESSSDKKTKRKMVSGILKTKTFYSNKEPNINISPTALNKFTTPKSFVRVIPAFMNVEPSNKESFLYKSESEKDMKLELITEYGEKEEVKQADRITKMKTKYNTTNMETKHRMSFCSVNENSALLSHQDLYFNRASTTLNYISVQPASTKQEFNSLKILENEVLGIAERIKNAGCDCASVLIVDDHEFNRVLLQTHLNKYKFRCKQAFNGKKAIEVLMEQKECVCSGIRVVFMDYDMPVMNGIEASKIMKQLASEGVLADIPIIAVTAYVGNDVVSKCFEAGMNDFMAKPYSLEGLLTVVSRWMSDAHS